MTAKFNLNVKNKSNLQNNTQHGLVPTKFKNYRLHGTEGQTVEKTIFKMLTGAILYLQVRTK